MEALTLIKIGGKVLDDRPTLIRALTAFAAIRGPKLLVHGGGKRASGLCERLGIEARMHRGRRITDQPTLEVVTMVYAGLINKQLVAELQRLGCDAVGLSGADGDLILARKRPVGEVDFGWVGDVERVRTALIDDLLEKNRPPVVCAITHDGAGQLLNTNADTVAASLAAALAARFDVRLKFCFEKAGVLADPADDASVVAQLSEQDYLRQVESGHISAGMIPKLNNAFLAKKAGVQRVTICGIDGIPASLGTVCVA